jgi:hypothetical protein
MIRFRLFAALALIAATVFAAVHYSEGSTAEAGLFFRRDGSRRTPLRTAAGAVRQVVENTASRRAARGAPVIFPGLRAAAICSTGAARVRAVFDGLGAVGRLLQFGRLHRRGRSGVSSGKPFARRTTTISSKGRRGGPPDDF